MTTLVFGRTGQLGRALSAHGGVVCVGRDALDFADASAAQVEAVLDAHPMTSGVIIAAAYTDVNGAETDEPTAHRVNADMPGLIARACAARDLPLVHISTDYVFNGQASAPVASDHPTGPLNAYGRTKLAGERAVAEAGGGHAVLRTSWVFDATSRNFFTTMLRLGADTHILRVVDDQFGRPTYAPDLADACLTALDGLVHGKPSGVYHVTNSGPVASWADYAEAVMALSGLDATVERVGSDAFPSPARRPAFAALDTASFEHTFGATLPDWRDAVTRALAARGQPTSP